MNAKESPSASTSFSVPSLFQSSFSFSSSASLQFQQCLPFSISASALHCYIFLTWFSVPFFSFLVSCCPFFFFVFFLVQPSIFQPKTVLSPKPKTFCFFSSALLFSFNACLFVQPTQLFQPLFVLFQPFFFLLVLFSAHLFFCFSLFSLFLQRLPFCSVQRHSFHLLFFLLFFSFQFTCCPFFSPKTFFSAQNNSLFSPKPFSVQPKTFFSKAPTCCSFQFNPSFLLCVPPSQFLANFQGQKYSLQMLHISFI